MSNWLKSSDQAWWYSPTKEDLERTKPIHNSLKLSGDWVFHTIQWEWDRAGRPTTFVRLHFCNLNCSRCDARYTWRMDTPEYYKEPSDVLIQDLIVRIINAQKSKWLNALCKNITFTWWEPLIQQKKIEQFLQYEGIDDWKIQVETNWTLMPSDYLFERCKFNCSPKLKVSDNDFKRRYSEKVLRKLAEKEDTCFKFVFRTKEDIDETLQMYSHFISPSQIWFMPEGVTKEENTNVFVDTIDYILTTWCNVAIRWQNVMRDWAIRWV